jgi:hypothetical protein
VRELGKVVSCGGCGEKGWRTELDLSRRKSLDDHHGSAAVGTEPKRSGFLGGGGWWLGLRLNHCEGLPAKWQESGPPPVGEEAEVANADEAFGRRFRFMQAFSLDSTCERVGLPWMKASRITPCETR